MSKLNNFFKLEENGTTVRKELVAGATTFFAMAYIMFVNPNILWLTGMEWKAVFLATIIAAVAGTLVMGLFANVPYAQAPGMGLNAFFTFTIVFGFGFSWQEALAMVFICGLINIVITVTKVRKSIIKAIPKTLQSAIGAGIGLFIAYIGFKNAGFLKFTTDFGHYNLIGDPAASTVVSDSSIVPALSSLASPESLIAIFGLILTVVLLLLKVKASILIGIGASTIVAVIVHLATGGSSFAAMGLYDMTGATFAPANWGFKELGGTIGQCFVGMGTLFSTNIAKLPIALVAIFAFSVTDTFDTIGTFIGTGKRSGIFTEEDEIALETGSGFSSKMDKALFADAVATSVGAIFGTSNTTTYVESAAGIEAGGRTGLASVFTAGFFLLSIILAPIAGIVPGAATAPALIIVGIMMMAALKDIDWADFGAAVPAFLTIAFMAFSYSISNGIAIGFILYCVVALCQKRAKELHPIFYGATILFVIYLVFMALVETGVI